MDFADSESNLETIRGIGRAAAALRHSDSVIVAQAALRIHSIALDLLIEISPHEAQGSWQVLA